MKLKGIPTTVRLETEKLEFVKAAFGLKSVQQTVDFLLDRVFWQEWEKGKSGSEKRPLNGPIVHEKSENSDSLYDTYSRRISAIENEHDAHQICVEINSEKLLSANDRKILLNSVTSKWSI